VHGVESHSLRPTIMIAYFWKLKSLNLTNYRRRKAGVQITQQEQIGLNENTERVCLLRSKLVWLPPYTWGFSRQECPFSDQVFWPDIRQTINIDYEKRETS
jgi:hypothetical protein